MQLLWNRSTSDSFFPSRGIRQGDPLSPYLFMLCMERLAQLIHLVIHDGSWKPIRLVRNGPTILHLFFADDMLLFAEASETQVNVIEEILHKFCVASGQKVSVTKTNVFFSKNVMEPLGLAFVKLMIWEDILGSLFYILE